MIRPAREMSLVPTVTPAAEANEVCCIGHKFPTFQALRKLSSKLRLVLTFDHCADAAFIVNDSVRIQDADRKFNWVIRNVAI